MAIELITLDEYKQAKKINSTNDDALITKLIEACSSYVKSYLGRTLVDHFSTPKVESLRPNKSKLYLKEFPLVEVSSVQLLNTEDSTYVTLVEDVDYYVDYDVDAIETVLGDNFSSSNSPKGIIVTYTGGYEVIPAEIRMAVIDLVTFYLKGEYVQKKEMGGMDTISFKNLLQIEHNLPQHIARALEMHRQSVTF